MTEHLRAIASAPRAVGSEANAKARRYCADQLRSLGFDVTERPFEFSALAGRYGAQLFGGVAVVGYGLHLIFGRWFGLVTLLALAVLARWLGRKNATRRGPLRTGGVNLEAVRGVPRVWLVAHIDSKSQGISSALRTVGAVLITSPVVVALIVPGLRMPIAALGLAGGLILCAASVGTASDGAADNASGVAAVLDAVALVPSDTPLGVLITDAEELALAGAAAWVSGRSPAIAINCDTIDDIGTLVVFEYGYLSHALDEKAGPVARSVDPGARVMRPPPGVLTDSNAFHAAGWQTVTLSRGTIRTLNRIHTRRDSLDSLRGTGIPDAARVLARLAEELA